MFVFKAAVVGAGTMGGQIAQTIAAAGIPVVLKDIDDALVQAGLEEARNVTQGQVGKLAEKGKITAEQAEAQIEEILGRIQGTTSYDGFGDVDFVIEAVPEKMEIKQSVFAELDAATPGHAILASNTSSLSITEIGEATLRPEQGHRLPLLLPRLDHAADRDRRGRGDLRGDRRRGRHVRPGDPQAADHLRRGPRLRGQPHPQLGRLGGLARAGGEGLSIKKIDEGVGGRRRGPGRSLPAGQPARPGHGPARRRAPRRVLRRGTLLRAQGHAQARLRRQARREDRRRWLLRPPGRAEHRGRGRSRRGGAGGAAVVEDVARGMSGAGGGRGDPSRHRLRHDGRRRPGSPPRACCRRS